MPFIISLFFMLCSALSCAALSFENKQLEAQLEVLFAPGRDMLDVKLVIDAMAGGTAGNTKFEIDQMVATLKATAAGAQTSNEKLKILRRFIYEPGKWNGGRAFVYDHADPLAKNPVNRILSHYVETRLGNCVTMPVLFMILGRRIGLNLTLSTAPLHVLVKYTDDDGAVWNLEPTSGGGFMRDFRYSDTMTLPDEAVANGIYLRTLSDAENVGVIAGVLVEHYLATNKPEDAIITADIILLHNPLDAHIMVKRASAFYLLLKRDVIARYPHQSDLTPEIKAYGDELSGFAAAEALGWRETDGQNPTQTGTNP
jgi:regulator of sirC expression with transglutaminase-like and TPR domain